MAPRVGDGNRVVRTEVGRSSCVDVGDDAGCQARLVDVLLEGCEVERMLEEGVKRDWNCRVWLRFRRRRAK